MQLKTTLTRNDLIVGTSEIADSPTVFRPIHYLGSKLRIVDFIQSTIDDIDPTQGAVCDLFAGSGCVAQKLSATRAVTSVDIQEYSRVICSALLQPPLSPKKLIDHCDTYRTSKQNAILEKAVEPLINYEAYCIGLARKGNCIPLFELIESGSIIGFEAGMISRPSSLARSLNQVVSNLKKANSLNLVDSLTVRYFGGLYFSYKQAVQIDCLLDAATKTSQAFKDTFLATVLSTASDAVNTIGKQFAQPLKPRKSDGTLKHNLLNKIFSDRNIDIFSIFQEWLHQYALIKSFGRKNKVCKMDYSQALDNLSESIKVVYADPPYTRDHYSRFYHVLETLALRDCPTISKSCLPGKAISRGMYREARHQSPFCIKRQAAIAFENLFSRVRKREIPLLLSYSPYSKSKKSHPRMMTIEQLQKIAKKYYPRVDTISPGKLSHSKLNRTDKNFDIAYEAELLLVCRLKK